METELLRAMLLDQETFNFAVIHYCVLLFDKTNASEIHKKALAGDDNATEVLQRIEKFNNARARLVEMMKNESLFSTIYETLTRSDQVEEFELEQKRLLMLSKRRGGTRSFIVSAEASKVFNALFYVHHCDKIIKESFLCMIKKDSKKLAILGTLCWTMWCKFSEKVSILLDYMPLKVNAERRRGSKTLL